MLNYRRVFLCVPTKKIRVGRLKMQFPYSSDTICRNNVIMYAVLYIIILFYSRVARSVSRKIILKRYKASYRHHRRGVKFIALNDLMDDG